MPTRYSLRTDRILPHHEGEGESDNEHLCGALDTVTDQNVNRSDVRSKKHDCHNAPLFQGGYHHQNDRDSESTCCCDAHGPQPPLGHSVTSTRCVFSRRQARCSLKFCSMYPQWSAHASDTQTRCVRLLRGRRAARNGGQPASHRRRPLEVAIFIVDGTNK